MLSVLLLTVSLMPLAKSFSSLSMILREDPSIKIKFENCMSAAPSLFGVTTCRGERVAVDVGGFGLCLLDSFSPIDLSERTKPNVILSDPASFFIWLWPDALAELRLRWCCHSCCRWGLRR